jgi:hypothetical protein
VLRGVVSVLVGVVSVLARRMAWRVVALLNSACGEARGGEGGRSCGVDGRGSRLCARWRELARHAAARGVA